MSECQAAVERLQNYGKPPLKKSDENLPGKVRVRKEGGRNYRELSTAFNVALPTAGGADGPSFATKSRCSGLSVPRCKVRDNSPKITSNQRSPIQPQAGVDLAPNDALGVGLKPKYARFGTQTSRWLYRKFARPNTRGFLVVRRVPASYADRSSHY